MNDSCILNVNIMFLGLFFCFLILSIGDLNLSDGFSYHLHMDDAQISLQTKTAHMVNSIGMFCRFRKMQPPALPHLLLIRCRIT